LMWDKLTIQAFSWAFFGLFVGGQYSPFHALIDVYLLLAEVYHDMGEHFVDIPPAVFVTQMIVSTENDEPYNRRLTIISSASGPQSRSIRAAFSPPRPPSFFNTDECSLPRACA
jgi:hypothetical protein